MPYRGRFAPTPSGPLHAGSLLTALAGYLQARTVGGRWLLRVDDLDVGRCRPEFTEMILRQLEAHGLHWDEPPRRQSQHIDAYRQALEQLRSDGLIYPCCCTRAQLARTSIEGIDGPVYAGSCRRTAPPMLAPRYREASWRLRVESGSLILDDACQGTLRRDLECDLGDFVVQRADGQIAYQLACVIDESDQNITEVVRGADLIGSSFRQRYLQALLDLPRPDYLHVPVLAGGDGRKLSKQNHAPPIDGREAPLNLLHGLQALGQNPPQALAREPVHKILDWAKLNWKLERVTARPHEISRVTSVNLGGDSP